MHTRFGLCVLSALALCSACTPFGAVDAVEQLAAARQCDPIDVTVAADGDTWQESGCGEPAAFDCADGSCESAGGDAAPARSSRAETALSELQGLADQVSACTDDAPAKVQVFFGADGVYLAARVAPDDGDATDCVRIASSGIRAPAGDGPLVVSHDFGQPSAPEPVAPVAPVEPPEPAEPTEPAEPMEPSEPEEPAADEDASEDDAPDDDEPAADESGDDDDSGPPQPTAW